MADAGEIRIDISEPIMQEVQRVLRLKFEWTPGALEAAELQMNAIARKVVPMQAVDVVKDDPSDNRILNASELLDVIHDQGRTS